MFCGTFTLVPLSFVFCSNPFVHLCSESDLPSPFVRSFVRVLAFTGPNLIPPVHISFCCFSSNAPVRNRIPSFFFPVTELVTSVVFNSSLDWVRTFIANGTFHPCCPCTTCYLREWFLFVLKSSRSFVVTLFVSVYCFMPSIDCVHFVIHSFDRLFSGVPLVSALTPCLHVFVILAPQSSVRML